MNTEQEKPYDPGKSSLATQYNKCISSNILAVQFERDRAVDAIATTFPTALDGVAGVEIDELYVVDAMWAA